MLGNKRFLSVISDQFNLRWSLRVFWINIAAVANVEGLSLIEFLLDVVRRIDAPT